MQVKDPDFKYTAKFDAVATFDFGKWKEAKAKREVFASLDNLRSLLPEDAEIKDNPDLLYTSFNVAVVNLVNANDHGIATDTALAISKYFVNKQANIEHSRWDIIGHIISQGFSSFGESKILTADKLAGTKEPFNICVGAVVYKIVREYMAQIIKESSDKTSDYHEYISASWEIGFNEFDIILGSKKISDATVISDPKEVAKYTPYLRMEGGDGFTPDGTPVYCLIKGDARPLGCGFTSSPAAAVKGVFVPEEKDEEEDPDRESSSSIQIGETPITGVLITDASISGSTGLNASITNTPIDVLVKDAVKDAVKKELEEIASKAENDAKNDATASSDQNNDKNLKNNNKNNSQHNKKTVNKNMKLKSTDDITSEYLQTAEASELKSFISDELKKVSDEYIEKLNKSETDKSEVASTLETTDKTLKELQTKFENLQKQVEAKEKQEAFDTRMDELSSEYELDDKQTKVVASQIKDLDETAYASWKTSFEPFGKKKVVASTNTEEKPDPVAALQNASASSATLPNAQSPEVDEFADMVGTLNKVITFKR